MGETDTISRQAAIDALDEYFARIVKLKRRGLTKGEKAISLDTVGAIKTLPSAQPKRMPGKWKKISPASIYECSVCGQNIMTQDIDAYRYCHGCGADMRGEQND